MSTIKNKFDELKKNNKKALITFVTAGDPNIEASGLLIEEMVKKGADIIEIGVPYSDPVAEGPIIQSANMRALKNNIKLLDVIEFAASIKKRVGVPIIFLLYYNCIFKYSPEKFFYDLAKAKVDGVIVPDLPYEERNEVKKFSDENNVDLISMVSPVSENRIKLISKDARGFLYCVSSLGVTGIRSKFFTDFEKFMTSVKKYANVPTAIGFGISNEEHVRELKKYADGLIVGSAIVEKVGNSRSIGEAVDTVGEYVKKLRNALDEN